MLRPEQFNIEEMLVYFVSRSEYSREYILDMLKDLSDDEIKYMNLTTTEGFYSECKRLFEEVKDALFYGSHISAINDVNSEYSIFYKSFLKTYPLKRILDVRQIEYFDLDDDKNLFDKILESNPSEDDLNTVVITDENDTSFTIIGLEDEDISNYCFIDKEIIQKTFIKEILDKRNVKYNPNLDVDGLIFLVLVTNPYITNINENYADNYYLEAYCSYTRDYLKKYGLTKVLQLRYNENVLHDSNNHSVEIDFDMLNNFEYDVNSLWNFVNLTQENIYKKEKYNSDKELVNNLNLEPLVYDSLYEEDYLIQYAFCKLLDTRNIDYDKSVTNINDLFILITDSNPDKDETYYVNLKEVSSDILIVRNQVYNENSLEKIVIDNKYFIKKGRGIFLGKNKKLTISHDANTKPIAIQINNVCNDPNRTVGSIHVEYDKDNIYVFNNGLGGIEFEYVLFFDNTAIPVKLTETYDKALQSIIGSGMFTYSLNLKPIATMYYVDLKYPNGEPIKLDKSTTSNEVLNTKIVINGATYTISTIDKLESNEKYVHYDSNINKIFIKGLITDGDKDSVSLLNMNAINSNDRDNYPFNQYIFCNEYLSFGEVTIDKVTNEVTIDTKLDGVPNYIVVTPITDSTDPNYNYGIITYEALSKTNNDIGKIKINKTGNDRVTLKWLAICDTDNITNETYSLNSNSYIEKPLNNIIYNINSTDINNFSIYNISSERYRDKFTSNSKLISDDSEITISYLNYLDKSDSNKRYLAYDKDFENHAGNFNSNSSIFPRYKDVMNYNGLLRATVIESFNGMNIAQFINVNDTTDFTEGSIVAYNYHNGSNKYFVINDSATIEELNDATVVGVVTNRYSLAINTYNDDDKKVPIAVSGMVYVKCDSNVKPGDLLTYNRLDGLARAIDTNSFTSYLGRIIGKALEPHTANSEYKYIKMMVSIM